MIKNKLLFVSLFTFLGFIFLQIPFTNLVGSHVSFTLFDFFAPIAGAFLGPIPGVISVLSVELINVFVHQTPVSTASIIRLFPILFAVYYFATITKQGKHNRLILFVPILAIIAFNLHPIGKTVWYYSLFWLIPFLGYYKRDLLLMRSLGATFTAHAVGGAAWIWAFNLPAPVWNSLIPIVIQERLLFTFGIALSFILIKKVLEFLAGKKVLPAIKTVTPAFS